MRPEVLVVLYAIAVGVTTAGFINSAIELVLGRPVQFTSFLSPRYSVFHLLRFMTVGALGFYQRARVHGQHAMQAVASEWPLAILSACVGLAWSFMLGVAVINLVHLIP